MTESADPVRSRRSLLAASLGGLAALVGHALGRPADAQAANGDPVVLGTDMTATSVTTIRNKTNVSGVLQLDSLGTAFSAVSSSEAANAIQGESNGANGVGVWGRSAFGYGIGGLSDGGIGVDGRSEGGTGVYGTSASSEDPAIVGRSYGGSAGLFGFAGGGAPPAAPQDTGVYGFATGYALRPASAAVGVHGRATAGTGVLAQADQAGTALRVYGKATFSRSGILTIGAGKASISKSVAGLTSGSLVFAVVRTGDGKAWVRKVKPFSGSFTVYLNKVLSSTTTVSWIAFG